MKKARCEKLTTKSKKPCTGPAGHSGRCRAAKKLRECERCGHTLGSTTAAHSCPHDVPCRWLTVGQKVKFGTAECKQCR